MSRDKLSVTIRNNRYTLFLSIIFIIGVTLFATLILVDRRIPGSDDTVFQTQTLPYHTVIDWIVYRYHNWSGRIFSEGFTYIFSAVPFYFWQIVSVLMYVLFSATLFGYYRLFSKDSSQNKDYFMLTVALSLPFLADKSVLADGGLWMTGAIVYFWISALGLVAFYPIAYYVTRRQQPHWAITCLGTICAIIAASSQEQVGAVLLGLSVAFLVYRAATAPGIYRAKVPWYLVFFCAIIGCSLFISLVAPGNTVRLKAEVITWLPDFYTTSITQRIDYGYRWFLDSFINHTGFLLIMSWGSMAALFTTKKKSRVDYVFIFVLTLACVFGLSKGFESTSYWVNFYATWKPYIPNLLASLNLVPWGVILVFTVIAPFFLFRKEPIAYLLALLYLAAFAATVILLLSPTMYASLWRCFFVPSVVLMFIAYVLFDRVLRAYWQYRYIFIGLIVSLATSHYIFQAARLVHNLHS